MTGLSDLEPEGHSAEDGELQYKKGLEDLVGEPPGPPVGVKDSVKEHLLLEGDLEEVKDLVQNTLEELGQRPD